MSLVFSFVFFTIIKTKEYFVLVYILNFFSLLRIKKKKKLFSSLLGGVNF